MKWMTAFQWKLKIYLKSKKCSCPWSPGHKHVHINVPQKFPCLSGCWGLPSKGVFRLSGPHLSTHFDGGRFLGQSWDPAYCLIARPRTRGSFFLDGHIYDYYVKYHHIVIFCFPCVARRNDSHPRPSPLRLKALSTPGCWVCRWPQKEAQPKCWTAGTQRPANHPGKKAIGVFTSNSEVPSKQTATQLHNLLCNNWHTSIP